MDEAREMDEVREREADEVGEAVKSREVKKTDESMEADEAVEGDKEGESDEAKEGSDMNRASTTGGVVKEEDMGNSGRALLVASTVSGFDVEEEGEEERGAFPEVGTDTKNELDKEIEKDIKESEESGAALNDKYSEKGNNEGKRDEDIVVKKIWQNFLSLFKQCSKRRCQESVAKSSEIKRETTPWYNNGPNCPDKMRPFGSSSNDGDESVFMTTPQPFLTSFTCLGFLVAIAGISVANMVSI